MKNKNIIAVWLGWQFSETPIFLWQVWGNYMKFATSFFSFTQLIKTFFSPWHRYKWAYPKSFDIKEFFNTLISNAVSRILGALMRIVLIVAGALFQVFVALAGLVVFIGWLLLPFVFFLGLFFILFTAVSGILKFLVLAAIMCLFFWDISLFTKNKIKKTSTFIEFGEVEVNLNFELAKIYKYALNFCKKRKKTVSSDSLFYAAAKQGRETKSILLRLGIDSVKLQADIKNYMEKSGAEVVENNAFTKDFFAVITQALKIAGQTGREVIGEKEILVALAKQNKFFKEILVEFDLKEEDVENLTAWLNLAEESFEKSIKFWSAENLARAGSVGRSWTSGYTLTLDQFSVDWSHVVSMWAFREIIGHKKEIETAEMALARSNLSNVLIVGEPGTGRKSIIQAIAQKCYLGKSLTELNEKRVVELDLVKLASRIQNFEKLEAILDRIFYEVVSAGNVILVIDELHNFVEQKGQRPGVIDISGILSKYLSESNLKFIGIITYDGLHRCIERNRSFAEFFRKVEVAEISEAETIRVLQTYAMDFEYKNKILILYPAIREIVNLTAKYIPSLPFPKKAIDILDEAVVYLQTQKESVLMPHHIAEVISQKTEIPVGKMDVKEKEVLLNLENLIHQRIVNQEEAVKEISVAMRRARSGISSSKRPMGTFLFMGPTGVGKTETSKALAKIYFGQEEKMIRLDMSEFQAISDIPRLIGAVSPVEMQGLLTTQVRETPFSLVLLDEVEKAHPDILNLLLQVLDEGWITDGQGRKVAFTNTIIICTSNAGAQMIFKQSESGEKLDKEKFISHLVEKNLFRPEFINRFDASVVFHPLTKENLLDISGLMLGSLIKNLKEKEIVLEVSDELKEKIVEMSYKPEFGAREMRRVIQDTVENTIAQALISEKIKKGDTIEINSENFEVVKISA